MSTQSLYEKLQHAKTEEDVKDIYIKALDLKSYTEGLIDIRTKEIWFEAKNTGKHSSYAMFTQLLHYVQQAFNKVEELPLNERSFKGAFYTPLNIVDKAYDKLTEVLGKYWQEEYIIWDMCCGVGNLEIKHSNPYNVFMSTLDEVDINIIQANKTCAAASHFQYDYLNDDISDDGKIDYNLTKKVPEKLQQAISENKKILVLINPPYAESGKGFSSGNKTGVAKTKFSKTSMVNYGKATNELFTQFIARIAQEMPTATIAMFSKLKYVNAPNFEQFRKQWNAKYLGGFIVHSRLFDGLKGNFPIGFLIWQTNQHSTNKTPINEITAEILDKNIQPIGEKRFYNLPNDTFLSAWIERPKPNKTPVIPLKNTISPANLKINIATWSDGAIAHMLCDSNDLQHSVQTALFSSVHGIGHNGGFYVNSENLWQAAIVFTVRRIIKPTWINDRDQFLQPNQEIGDEFKNDCLIWMLFNGSNLTASANELEWNEKKMVNYQSFYSFHRKRSRCAKSI